MNDRRCDLRIKEEANVTIHTIESSISQGEEPLLYYTSDISIGGMQLCVNRNFPIGSFLSMEVSFISSAGKYNHLGEVVWSKGSIALDIDTKLYHRIGIKLNTAKQYEYQAWLNTISALTEKHNKYHDLHLPLRQQQKTLSQ